MRTYIDCFEYMRSPTGQELNSLIGNKARLSSSVAVNATSLPVTPPTTVDLYQFDQVTIFDGAKSEVVTVNVDTLLGATSIPLMNGCAFAHDQYTTLCSDGTNGSLAETILSASATLEGITQQSLIQATNTETYSLRTMDANINSDGQLTVRTRQFPVTAISALSIETSVGSVTALDATQAIITSQDKLISVPVIAQVGAGPSQLILQSPLSQTSSGVINLTYTAGFAYASMPWQYKQACILLTSNVLSDRLNPMGAADYQSGSVKTSMFLRGDTSGESALYKRVVQLLEPVTRER